MIFKQDRFEDVSDKTKMIMLEVENETMQEMLSEALESMAHIEFAVTNLRQALYLELEDTE